MKHEFYGLLSYNDNGEYEIDGMNISQVLYDAYYDTFAYSNLPVITIKINNTNRMLMNEKGELYLKKDDYGIYSWFVNDISIDDLLFNAVDEILDIMIYV